MSEKILLFSIFDGVPDFAAQVFVSEDWVVGLDLHHWVVPAFSSLLLVFPPDTSHDN